MPRSPFSGSPLPPDCGPTLADALWDATRHPDPVESHRLVDALLTRAASARAALRARGIDVDGIIRTMAENRPTDPVDRAVFTLADEHASDAHREAAVGILARAFRGTPRSRDAQRAVTKLARERGQADGMVLRDLVKLAVVYAAGDVTTPMPIRLGRTWVKDAALDYVPSLDPAELRTPAFARWFRGRVYHHIARLACEEELLLFGESVNHAPDESQSTAATARARRDGFRRACQSRYEDDLRRREPDAVGWLPPSLDDSPPDLTSDLSPLSDTMRRIVSLRDVDGRTFGQIARALCLRRDTVKLYYRRARSRLAR